MTLAAPSADRTWLGDTPPDDLLPLVWFAPPEAPKYVETVDVDGEVGL